MTRQPRTSQLHQFSEYETKLHSTPENEGRGANLSPGTVIPESPAGKGKGFNSLKRSRAGNAGSGQLVARPYRCASRPVMPGMTCDITRDVNQTWPDRGVWRRRAFGRQNPLCVTGTGTRGALHPLCHAYGERK